MLISYNWIKQYVDLPDSLTPEELALKLTMSTVEVDGVEHQGKLLENIVVGEVKKIDTHPDADKLQVCMVSDGNEDFQVVCGGSNLSVGMKVAYGKVGSKVKWHGEGELIELKKAKIRGVASYGMACTPSEIGLADMFPTDHERVLLDISDSKAKLGTPLAEALGLNDVVFDIDNKSMTHRPDLWGHYGMAREVAAAYNKKLKEYKSKKIRVGTGLDLSVRVENKELCPRYMAVAIDGVKVASSPEWLQQRLIAVGLKPINNIVDITNYILYDLGQPMHAFDAAHISGKREEGRGKRIVVRHAEDGEKFVTLDETEHELTSDMLVIADSEKALAVAGVMGGQNSGITDETTTIIYESANFDATNVRRTANKLGLRTDSSARFEKSLDPHNAGRALRRAVALTLELCPDAKVVSKVVDQSNFKLNQGPIELSLDFLNQKIGKEIPKKEVIKILESLGFDVKDRVKSRLGRDHATRKKVEVLEVTVPTWRATKDISIAEDLVEEVARVYGFGNVETSMPLFNISPPEVNHLRELERAIKDRCALEFGYTESLNYSFVSPQLLSQLHISTDKHIELDNPIAKDRPLLRRSLLPNLIKLVEKNTHDRDELRVFEIGKVFHSDESGVRMSENSDELLPRQDVIWSGVFTHKKVDTPFFEISSMMHDVCEKMGAEITLEKVAEVPVPYHSGRVAHVMIGDEMIGLVGELHPAQQKSFGIDSRVGMFELNLNRLLEYTRDHTAYAGVPAYPPMLRDIAFVVDQDIMHADVVSAIRDVDTLITRVELFDVFSSEKLGENKKSMAYHITYMSKDKTLETGKVDTIHEKVVKVVKDKFEGEVRS